MSVPERIGTWKSLRAEVRENLGSTCMITAPRAWALRAHLKVMGWCSAALEPMIRMASAFWMSL